MCFPAMDNLRLGGFFLRGGGRTPQQKGRRTAWSQADGPWTTSFLWTFPSEVFDCFNVVALPPANGGLLIKNTCAVTEIHIRD